MSVGCGNEIPDNVIADEDLDIDQVNKAAGDDSYNFV